MRIDAIAYQRATRVAAIGLLLQFAIGLTLLLFGFAAKDDTFVYAASYALFGILVWVALVVVFNQHKLAQLEALESDELQQQRLAGLGSAFDTESEEFNVAARRLRLMHKWLMPIVSWLMIILLAGTAIVLLSVLRQISNPAADTTAEFDIIHDNWRGWGLAICLLLGALSFICSRFVAGMSKQPAWQNLRGGAGYMVGNALVMLALSVGIVFTYFNNTAVMRAIAHAILIFMMILAAEFVLNFLLNLYRPRRAGEVPRPAFDSRLLSLLSAPDSIVRSINEAINYQFGFDITSSWGYQLLLRAVWKLAVFAIIVIVLLNCMVIVEPHQQAVKLRGGEIQTVANSGLMWKLPWPIETAEVHDVSRVRTLALTVQLPERPAQRNEPILWAEGLDRNLGIEPFIVATNQEEIAPAEGAAEDALTPPDVATDDEKTDEAAQQAAVVSQSFALVEAGFDLAWRIRPDSPNATQSNLEKFIRFANDVIERRQSLQMREEALKSLALREVSQYLATQDLDGIVAADRADMIANLQDRVQAAFDAYETGVEVVAVLNPWIRPAGEAGTKFEELSFNLAALEKDIAQAERKKLVALATAAGSVERAEDLYALILEYDDLSAAGADEAALAEQQARIERALLNSGGEAGRIIANAHADRWTKVLLAQARLEQFRGRLAPYRAGPEIYKQYLLMEALAYALEGKRKIFFGIDQNNINLGITMLRDDETMQLMEMLQTEEQANENP